MKQQNIIFFLSIVSLFIACQPNKKTLAVENKAHLSPDERYGQLFDDVQKAAIFKDSKTFCDGTPTVPTDEVMRLYALQKQQSGFNLKNFVDTYFTLPQNHADTFKSDTSLTLEQHIQSLWQPLTRQPDATTAGTLLPLPKPYIVPGGRFGEIYYWDSYFTMLGLQADGRTDVVENMVENFAYLIDQHGFIPNGNRTYYLTRSQPPFFSMMVSMLAEMKKTDSVLTHFLPQMEREYSFWKEKRSPTNNPDGLFRYSDAAQRPRPEAYSEDIKTAQKSGGNKEEVYHHLRSAAESGWDFSSRWFADEKNLTTIHTADIAPVDLNCLIFALQQNIARGYAAKGDSVKAADWKNLATAQKNSIQKYFWDSKNGFYYDYDLAQQKHTPVASLAGIFPLFFKIASPKQAAQVGTRLQKYFLKAGGLVSTPNHTGQQWDAPNGWSPLQWVAMEGLRHYDNTKLADTIATRWVGLANKVYKKTGKILEKYNVEDLTLEAGGGEYPVQDGFGWTNGVLLRLLHNPKKVE